MSIVRDLLVTETELEPSKIPVDPRMQLNFKRRYLFRARP